MRYIDSVLYLWKKILSSYFLQFTLITLLSLVGFYKIFSFSFHANREIGWVTPVIDNISFISLMKWHAFINIVNFYVYGTNAWGWYLTGFIFHILATSVLVIFIGKLTKSRLIGFLTGLWFAASPAWHDVVTFGSQESMYAAQLFLFFISALAYREFRERKGHKVFYSLSVFFFFIIIPLRESGLLYLPILVLFDLIFYAPWHQFRNIIGISRKEQKKALLVFLNFLLPLIPFLLISLVYILVRESFGGSPNDFNDGRVRLKSQLLAEGEYFDYLKYGIVTFGFYLPPHVIPYPLMNKIRDVFTTFFPSDVIKMLFFPFVGYIVYLFFVSLTYLSRKQKYFKPLLFSVTMITVPTFFYSFAFTTYEDFFLREYIYEEHRWRYVAFVGTSLFIILFFTYILRKFLRRVSWRYTLGIVVVAQLFVNIFFLWRIQDKMYVEMFREQKLFYKTFLTVFPDYNKDFVLYFFPVSGRLGDFMWEWYGLKSSYYPKLGELRKDWHYTEMNKVLNLLEKDKSLLAKLFFIDFNPELGVIDRTKEAREKIFLQKKVTLSGVEDSRLGSVVSFLVNDISPIEFPYLAKVTMSAQIDNSIGGNVSISSEKLQTLTDYVASHTIFLNEVKVKEVCNTHGKMKIYDKSHLIDGNFGIRSTWFADCAPGWFILDLGSSKRVSGFIMGSIKEDTHIPMRYSYEVSNDGNVWEEVMEVDSNTNFEIMDKWPKTYISRYVRVNVFTTQKGGFVQLDEAEPIFENASEVFDHWKSRESLTNDMRKIFTHASKSQKVFLTGQNINTLYVRFFWKTNLLVTPEEQTSFYFPIIADGLVRTYTVPIYESEYYSLSGQFLKRKIISVGLDFDNIPGSVIVDTIELIPTNALYK